MQDETLATELLKEVKASAKRWFICFCIMVGLEIATIVGFMWYISLPTSDQTTTTETQDVEQNTDNGGNNSFIGGDSNGQTEDKNN